MKSHNPYNAAIPIKAHIGAGSVAGAGELAPRGPGPAGKRKQNRFGAQEVPMGSTSGSSPKGMKTYNAQ